MVPSAFVMLPALPLTPNGKVDRKALPKPEIEVVADKFAPPRTQTEMTVAEIWSEVLQLKQIGIHDNFFELGGDSLLATKLTSRLRKEFRLEVPLRILFESSTLAALAANIEAMQFVLQEQVTGQRQDMFKQQSYSVSQDRV